MRAPVSPADVGLRGCTCLEENAVLASIAQVMGIVPEFQSLSDRCAVVSGGQAVRYFVHNALRLLPLDRPLATDFSWVQSSIVAFFERFP